MRRKVRRRGCAGVAHGWRRGGAPLVQGVAQAQGVAQGVAQKVAQGVAQV